MSGLDRLEPFTRRWLESELASGKPSLLDLSVEEARQRMRENQGVASQANLDLHLAGLLHDQRQACGCTVHILRPERAAPNLPVLAYFHGGGWVLGDFTTHARFVADLLSLTEIAVVFPDYDRAPETPFPDVVEQCYEVLSWIRENAASLGLDGTRMAVAGDSAGGNLATAVGMLAAQRGGPRLLSQALLYPVVDSDFNTESYRDFAQGFNLDASVMEWFWAHYIPDADVRCDPRASPLRAPLTALRGSPPALVISAECDVLRDEAEAYARRLADAGVPTAAYRCLGTVHSFLVANGLAESAPARSGMRVLAAHLRSAFQSRA